MFLLFSESLEKDCIVMNKGATPHASTIRYTVRKGLKGGSSPSNQRNGRTHKPITTPARSASAQSSSAVSQTSQRQVIMISNFLLLPLLAIYIQQSLRPVLS